MMAAVGDILGSWTFRVEEGKLREFARAVKDESLSDTAAIAPPTFTVVVSADFVERLVTELLPLDRKRAVHGGQSYEYFAPIRAGDVLDCEARLLSDETKQGRRGGAMRILKVAVEYRLSETGELACREVMTTIEKEAARP